MARTRAQDFEEKSRSILDHAALVFAEQGMDKASMSQIAQQAQVSKALLYHYYPSKDALIFAIIITHLEELDEAIQAADQHKVQLNGTAALTDDQKAQIMEVERGIVKRFSAVLDQINPGLNTRERPLLMPVTMSLFGMMNWVYMWFKDGGRISREDYADVATTLILEGIKAVR